MKFISFLNKYKFFLFFLTVGLTIFCYPMVKSGFDLIPGNGMDSKSISYILEHSWYWLNKVPLHEEFWSAPFYFPNKNNLAFSDSLMGLMPFYWLLRVFLPTFSAFQALMVVASILNYSTFYYLLKHQFKYCDLSSSVGSFIFAFGLMRLFRMVHLNYYSQYLTILALIFLLNIKKENSILKNNLYFLLQCNFTPAILWLGVLG